LKFLSSYGFIVYALKKSVQFIVADSVTFLFDSVFIWCVSVTIAFSLSRFTLMPVVAIYILVQMGDMIKCLIGFILVKKGVWLQNIVAN